MQYEYLIRFQDPQCGVRHTIVIASDEEELNRLIKARLNTVTWRGCKLIWAADVLTLQPRQNTAASERFEHLAQAIIKE
jgi:hypothetical protein